MNAKLKVEQEHLKFVCFISFNKEKLAKDVKKFQEDMWNLHKNEIVECAP